MKRILATPRLYLREPTQADFPALCKILQDKEVVYAYEHASTTPKCSNGSTVSYNAIPDKSSVCGR